MRSETQRLTHEQSTMREKIKENGDKIKQNKVLPYLVGNVVEILDMDPEGEEDGAAQDADSQRRGQCAVIKTSTRQVCGFASVDGGGEGELTRTHRRSSSPSSASSPPPPSNPATSSA